MEKFDVIVVGAGLAGLAAAYTLAQENLEVLVLEKGDYPGAKNVTGGRLYLHPVRELFPGLWDKAPLERHIVREEVALMARERSVTMSYAGSELTQPPFPSFSILRAKFDRWLAQQAEKKGAMLINKSRVDELILENGRVIGVRAGGDELGADVVIAADGVLSFTAAMAGLRKDQDPKHFAVGFKEVIELDRGIIEDRFGLEGDEGAARLFMGEVTKGKFGGGFLYTNKTSLSLGIVVGISDLMNAAPAIPAPQLLDEFKLRPEIARLIRGGETVEYSAHVIPEGGLKSMGRLYGDGILVVGDAAGFSMNIGVTVRGMEYALASGYYAAQAVIRAREKGDFTSAGLQVYQQILEESFVMKDFRNFKESLDVLEYPPLFNHIPELAGDLLRDLYAVGPGPKERIYPTLRNHLTMGEIWGLIKLGRRMMKI
ncbi:MAG: FAD-dependent oxidoreductase [Syntrophomonadaceae bacterium]|nr:FAD-dependent oxidoreductase [Syntrophomonadaceae bacterium]